jgi:hypothetical protein
MSDRAPAGARRARVRHRRHRPRHTDQMDGSRYFGEGGGGVTFGPFGVDSP